MKMLGVSELTAKLKLSPRGTRYVLDQRLVLLGDQMETGRGRHRRLSEAQALLVAIASRLHTFGITAVTIREISQFLEGSAHKIATFTWRPTATPHTALVIDLDAIRKEIQR